jgi:hypothetical protein
MREHTLRFLALDRFGRRSSELAGLPVTPADSAHKTQPLSDAGESEATADWQSLWIDLGGEG